MQLIYTDESGVNYSHDNGLFKDGPYLFYGGICVGDQKYFHLERMFIDIIKDFFSIEDWRAEEIHATNLWNLKGRFVQYEQKRIRQFFDELLQLIIKLDIHTVIGYQLKTANATETQKQIEEAKAVYAFLHGLEFFLSKKSETGLMIADQKSDLGNETSIFSKIFTERSRWRTGINGSTDGILKSKYIYESKLCFLIDNIHFVNSKDSLFNQIIDIVLYIIMRVWAYQNLRLTNRDIADITKVPIEPRTFRFFAGNAFSVARYENDDVMYDDIGAHLMFLDNFDEEILPDNYFGLHSKTSSSQNER